MAVGQALLGDPGQSHSGQHLRGNIAGSTFRQTVSALLWNPLVLEVRSKNALQPASNTVVSEYIAAHLRVVIAPTEDRDTVGAVEERVVRELDPPLNLDHVPVTPARSRLSELRRALRTAAG